SSMSTPSWSAGWCWPQPPTPSRRASPSAATARCSTATRMPDRACSTSICICSPGASWTGRRAEGMLRFSLHRGAEAEPFLDAVAALRIEVFADWPYLYQGDVDYERGYLARYARCPRALFVLAKDGETIVGASTGLPLI